MNEKIKIIIASVLKPIDDTRAFEKIGRSLAQTNKYDVNIIGFDSKKTATEKNISFWSILKTNRKHYLRFTAPLKIFKIYIKVKPNLILVNTPELLIVSYLYKIIFGCKIVYDIQENYQMNVSYGNVYSRWQKPIIKLILHITEGLSKRLVSHYLLAEKIYLEQLKFIDKEKTTVIENKAITFPIQNELVFKDPIIKSPFQFIISGTLGESYGTIDGVKFFMEFQKYSQDARLKIIGYAADNSYKNQLISLCNGNESINLEVKSGPIPHQDIIKAILKSDIALLPYKINDNLKFRIPTKLYEYLAFRKPMLITQNIVWEEILLQNTAGFGIDFNHTNIPKLLEKIHQYSFYKDIKLEGIYWDSEERKLLTLIDRLL